MKASTMAASERNYTFTMRAGKDGTQYLLIRERQPARSGFARRLAFALIESLNSFKAGFQKAFKFVSRRA